VCPMRWRSSLCPTPLEHASGRSDGGGGGFGGACFAVFSTCGLRGSAIRADERAFLRAIVLGRLGEGLGLGGETSRPGHGGRCVANALGLMSTLYQ
jgi:hypothetical protein